MNPLAREGPECDKATDSQSCRGCCYLVRFLFLACCVTLREELRMEDNGNIAPAANCRFSKKVEARP